MDLNPFNWGKKIPNKPVVKPPVVEPARALSTVATKAESAPPVEKKTPKVGRLDTEIELPLRATEASEQPRILSLAWNRYGKSVEFPGGPILPRFEHAVTGRSSDFPAGLSGHPSDYKFIFGTEVNKDGMPSLPRENATSRIIKISRMINGTPYFVCAAINQLSEGGQVRPNDRKYIEAITVAIPASEWSVAIIPQLQALLELKSHVKGEPFNLEPLSCNTEILDEPLPDGWLSNSVKELLMRVVTGQPVSIQDPSFTQKDILKDFYYVALCLPESVSREISFGAGLGYIDGQVRLGHGTYAMNPNSARKIGEAWKGDDAERLKFGEQYLAQLLLLASEAKTPRQLIAKVNTLPNELIQKVKKSVFEKA